MYLPVLVWENMRDRTKREWETKSMSEKEHSTCVCACVCVCMCLCASTHHSSLLADCHSSPPTLTWMPSGSYGTTLPSLSQSSQTSRESAPPPAVSWSPLLPRLPPASQPPRSPSPPQVRTCLPGLWPWSHPAWPAGYRWGIFCSTHASWLGSEAPGGSVDTETDRHTNK